MLQLGVLLQAPGGRSWLAQASWRGWCPSRAACNSTILLTGDQSSETIPIDSFFTQQNSIDSVHFCVSVFLSSESNLIEYEKRSLGCNFCESLILRSPGELIRLSGVNKGSSPSPPSPALLLTLESYFHPRFLLKLFTIHGESLSPFIRFAFI